MGLEMGKGNGGTTCKESIHNMRRAVCCVFSLSTSLLGRLFVFLVETKKES